MEMEDKHDLSQKKTKEELYLERLRKWKEQKVLKEEKANSKMTSAVKVVCRKPVVKTEFRNLKNIRQDKSAAKSKQTENQKTSSAAIFTQVNKKPSLKCKTVKSRLLDIPARLSAPPRRSTITSNVESKVDTRRTVGRQSMPATVQNTVRRAQYCIGGRAEVRHSHSKSASRPRRTSLAATRRSCDKQPHSILKRKSSVSYQTLQSEDGCRPCPDLPSLAHVKFNTCQDSSEHHGNFHSKYRKTPLRSQESLRNQLNSWLATKGKTPSRFRHLMCFDAEMSTKKRQDSRMKQSLTVAELSEQQDTLAKEDVGVSVGSPAVCGAESNIGVTAMDDPLDALLTQCQALIESDYPTDRILDWLQEIHDRVPGAAKSTYYYLLKVAILKPMGNLDPVLATFEEAITNSSQPADELARAMSCTVREMVNVLLEGCTGGQVRGGSGGGEHSTGGDDDSRGGGDTNDSERCVTDENVFQSTAIKYYVQEVSSFKKRRTSLCEGGSPQSARAVITPVRRSTRRSTPAHTPHTHHARTPASSRHTISSQQPKLYDSLADVPETEKTSLLFRHNDVMTTLLF